MTEKKTLALLLLLLMTLISCGGGDDDDDDTTIVNTPPQQEQPTPNTPNRPRTPTNSCLSSSDRTEITTLMNRLSDFSTINGSGTAATRNQDGTISTTTVGGSVVVEKLSDTSWAITSAYCSIDTGACPPAIRETYSFRDQCLFVQDSQARISSATSNTLRLTTTEGETRVERSLNSRNDKFRFTVNNRRNGALQSTLSFEED